MAARPPLAPHAPERRLIAGTGTDESVWLDSPIIAGIESSDVREWADRFRRIWLLAPHPDDEVLALGGSLAGLTEVGADLRIVSVTNGEGSHPGSSRWTRQRLAAARPLELQDALEHLGIHATVVALNFPDGRIDTLRDRLLKALVELIDERDLLLATCRFDGHPDHEACGDVADLVQQLTGATTFEYPVWMWHWALPAETTVPWERARRLPIAEAVVAKKRGAIGKFVSQVMPDGPNAAVLPPHVLPRFLRPFEVVFA